MLLITATDSQTLKEVDIIWDIKNRGKEHHISIFTKGTIRAPSGKLLSHYVISDDDAQQLKKFL